MEFDCKAVRDNLYKHVEFLSIRIGQRHLWQEKSLDRAADYIESEFHDSGYSIHRQTYAPYGVPVCNLIVEKPGTEDGVIVVGAHYDTVPGSPGADDNASAVAGLLELARLALKVPSRKRLVFAAFANEESPCFGSPKMGSMVYARHMKESKVRLDAMISLEMIGYFNKEETQEYPFPGMRLFYPGSADFLAVVGNFHSAKYVLKIKRGMKQHSAINTRALIAPEQAGGINRSDNYAFWKYGFRAVMLTDTSFYRNRNYHQETDTIDTLDFDSMTEVVKGLHFTLPQL